jgi:hypothetical protein
LPSRPRVQIYQASEARKLLEFTTQAESSKMPSAALQGGVTAAGMTIANAAVSGVK